MCALGDCVCIGLRKGARLSRLLFGLALIDQAKVCSKVEPFGGRVENIFDSVLGRVREGKVDPEVSDTGSRSGHSDDVTGSLRECRFERSSATFVEADVKEQRDPVSAFPERKKYCHFLSTSSCRCGTAGPNRLQELFLYVSHAKF